MNIDIAWDHPYLRFPRKETIRAVHCVLRREGRTARRVSLVFTNDRRIRTMNRKHLNHDYVTDVLSFELERAHGLETEIYINLDRARSQAREYGVSFTNETRRLLVHGMLHVLGYDDRTKVKRKIMRRREDVALQELEAGKNGR